MLRLYGQTHSSAHNRGRHRGGREGGRTAFGLGSRDSKERWRFRHKPTDTMQTQKIGRQERGGGGVGLVNVPVAPALKWIPSVVQSRRRLSDGLSHFFLQVSGHRRRSVSTARSSGEHPPSTSFTQHCLPSDSLLIAPPASSRLASEEREEPRSLYCLSFYSIL